MPLYEYVCPKCDRGSAEMRKLDERFDGPTCQRCLVPMALQVSAVSVIVKNPAVPRSSN